MYICCGHTNCFWDSCYCFFNIFFYFLCKIHSSLRIFYFLLVLGFIYQQTAYLCALLITVSAFVNNSANGNVWKTALALIRDPVTLNWSWRDGTPLDYTFWASGWPISDYGFDYGFVGFII